jgi:antitoxin (DNA-binding transcriptional repressor) of toxin-antitoxin stability system
MMHAITQLRILFRDALTSGNRPMLIALEPDMPDDLAWMIKAVHADLKRSGVSFLVHARAPRDIRAAFKLGVQEPMCSVFDTVIMTEPDYMTFIEVVDNRAISSEGVRRVRRGEILIAEAGRQPVRLHPAEPDMLAMASYTPTEPVQRPEPWSEPAVSYPLGASLPKQVVVKIPKQKVTKRQEIVPVTASQDAHPKASKSEPFVTKDDLTSGTARLKRALAKRAGGTSPSQARLI